jgi:hypothetical protein
MMYFRCLLFYLIFALIGCSSNSQQITNMSPVADAGADHIVGEGITVVITGRGFDSDGRVDAFSWFQIQGTTVALSGVDTSEISFVTPIVTGTETFIFQLTVVDNEGASHNDEISIIVNHRKLLKEIFFPDSSLAQCVTDSGLTFVDELTNLSCQDLGISDSTNIGQLTYLNELILSRNQISSIDISANLALVVLDLAHNQLTSIDISANTSLVTLILENNPFLMVPAIPLNILAVTGVGSATISWSPVADAEKYTIYKDSVAFSVNYNRKDQVEVLSPPYIWEGLSPEETYYFVVSAENNVGVSEYSIEVMARPDPNVSPPPPPSMFSLQKGNQEIMVSWDAVSTIQDYKIYIGTTQGVSKLEYQDYSIISRGGLAYEKVGHLWDYLSNNMRYYFVVTSIDGFGQEGIESAEVSDVPALDGLPPLMEVFTISLSGINGGGMDLWWTLVEGAVFYDFYISSTNDVTPSNYEEKIIREAYHGGYTVLQSKPGECRSIIMVARNSYGESGSSNVETACVPDIY